jgi:hypothetical protein
MELPVPTEAEVERFKALYESRFNARLSNVEALDVTTKALQLYYVLNYALPHLRSQEH